MTSSTKRNLQDAAFGVLTGLALYLSFQAATPEPSPASTSRPATARAEAPEAPFDGDSIPAYTNQGDRSLDAAHGLIHGLPWPGRPVGEPGTTCSGNVLQIHTKTE